MSEPPVSKYKFTATIRGNTHEEIVDELLSMTRGGYLLASDYYKRDSFDSTGGRDRMVLEHTNAEMTPVRYSEELEAWWQQRKADRATPAVMPRSALSPEVQRTLDDLLSENAVRVERARRQIQRDMAADPLDDETGGGR